MLPQSGHLTSFAINLYFQVFWGRVPSALTWAGGNGLLATATSPSCWEIACCGMPGSLPPLLRGPSAAATVATARRMPQALALSMLSSSEAMRSFSAATKPRRRRNPMIISTMLPFSHHITLGDSPKRANFNMLLT